MHCPKCGQQQISDEIRYCSRCGFLLTGIAVVVQNDGQVPGMTASAGELSPRRRGIKQGIFIFLLSFLLVPLFGIISVVINARPALAGLAAVLCVMGGLLRIVYALMFESNLPGQATLEENILAGSRKYIEKKRAGKELPAGDQTPATVYAAPAGGTWRDTNDLAAPSSVTDSTTKLLVKEQDDQ